MVKNAIKKLINKENLTYNEANACIDEIMSGNISDVQTSSFLTALSIKGETIEEITACANAMRKHSLKINSNNDLLEIVGTGGDNSNSFNISTTCSIVLAAAGVNVAKHGNRAASSKSGAADCLEALGVNLNLKPEESEKILNEIGICFLFAPIYHQSMKYVAPVRKELGIRTVFNLLGPLTNPANANLQVLGVYDESLLEPMGKALKKLGIKRGLVVFGKDKLDEVSLSDKTLCYEFSENEERTFEINPPDYGINLCKKEDLVGGSPKENAQITLDILNGKQGPKFDAVLLNTAVALYLARKVENIKDGIELARDTILSGKAKQKLDEFIKYTNMYN